MDQNGSPQYAVGPPWWFIALVGIFALSLATMFWGELPPQEKPPEVQTACVSGKIWTVHRSKYGQHADAVVIMNRSQVDCKEVQ